LPGQALAQRVGGHEGVELGEQRLVAAAGQAGVDPRLDGAEPGLREAGDLRLERRRLLDARQRLPPPERERVGPGVHRGVGAGRARLAPGSLDEGTEAVRVDGRGRQRQPVPRRGALDDGCGPDPGESLPQRRDPHLEDVAGPVGRQLGPELGGEAVHAHDERVLDGEEGEQRALLARRRRDVDPVDGQLHGAEDAHRDLHLANPTKGTSAAPV
jgi:hypothetical protein